MTDQEDFLLALAEYGITPEQARAVSENLEDQVPMPLPRSCYKFQTGPSLIEGRGVFATEEIVAGEPIAPARIGQMRTVVGRFTNHAAKPNAVMVKQPNGDINLVAVRDIPPHSEITINYRQALAMAKEQK